MSHQPLAGIAVVSLATNLPGPLAASRLTSLGAAVVKVEPPQGDPLAATAPSWYDELAAGQDLVTLDLKDNGDRARLEDLLVDADLLLTALRPSALARLGLPESIRRHRLAFVEVVGHDGDLSEVPGHDLTYQAAHGTIVAPMMPLVPVADLLGAERVVTAALAALRQRDRGDDVAHVRVALADAAHDAAAGVRHGLTAPGAVLGGALPGYGIYATTDGYIAVGALEPHFAARLATHVGRTRDALIHRFATNSSQHWEELGASLDIPIVAVREPRAVAAQFPLTPTATPQE